ncbi:uncharacterized protein AB675_2891 [Cyphellophora attinorum]|uniref:Uncharacterized protein n=1 Tax=Cyphellophora attinorum TaxID=1664694 RepID=A0A0N1NY30_9EURO|nr:uncharacterized protein AB675_2891 [Phialophora attinorum]KPI36457.1 hypothetical protein AB675_2891 [Phialophora attinorum]
MPHQAQQVQFQQMAGGHNWQMAAQPVVQHPEMPGGYNQPYQQGQGGFYPPMMPQAPTQPMQGGYDQQYQQFHGGFNQQPVPGTSTAFTSAQSAGPMQPFGGQNPGYQSDPSQVYFQPPSGQMQPGYAPVQPQSNHVMQQNQQPAPSANQFGAPAQGNFVPQIPQPALQPPMQAQQTPQVPPPQASAPQASAPQASAPQASASQAPLAPPAQSRQTPSSQVPPPQVAPPQAPPSQAQPAQASRPPQAPGAARIQRLQDQSYMQKETVLCQTFRRFATSRFRDQLPMLSSIPYLRAQRPCLSSPTTPEDTPAPLSTTLPLLRAPGTDTLGAGAVPRTPCATISRSSCTWRAEHVPAVSKISTFEHGLRDIPGTMSLGMKSDTMKTGPKKTNTMTTNTMTTNTMTTNTMKTDMMKTYTRKTNTLKTYTMKTNTMKTDTTKPNTTKTATLDVSFVRIVFIDSSVV